MLIILAAVWAAMMFFICLVVCLLFTAAIFVAKWRGHRGQWWALYVLGLHTMLSPLYLRLGGLKGKPSKVVDYFYCLMTLPLGCEIPLSVPLGRNLMLGHTAGVIINRLARIGDGCVITPGVVIGGNGRGGVPQVCDNVYIGANAVLVGNITVGSHSTIGAGTVVAEDVPESALVLGNPGKVVKIPYHRPYYDNAALSGALEDA